MSWYAIIRYYVAILFRSHNTDIHNNMYKFSKIGCDINK